MDVMILMLVMAAAGSVLGWLLFVMSDYLPRFATTGAVVMPHSGPRPAPAWWTLIASRARWSAAAARDPSLGLRIVVELVSAVLLAFAWWLHGPSTAFLLIAAAYSYLLLIAVIDLR